MKSEKEKKESCHAVGGFCFLAGILFLLVVAFNLHFLLGLTAVAAAFFLFSWIFLQE